MQTACEQLAEALRDVMDYVRAHGVFSPQWYCLSDDLRSKVWAALDRHRAEPEGCICSDCLVCAVSVRECQCADEGRQSHSGWGQK